MGNWAEVEAIARSCINKLVCEALEQQESQIPDEGKTDSKAFDSWWEKEGQLGFRKCVDKGVAEWAFAAGLKAGYFLRDG